MNERNSFIANGWRQFSIIRPTDHRYLRQFAKHIEVKNHDLLLIITQTCDLVNDVSKEPFFEVVVLRELGRPPSTEFLHAKNSRRLELTINIDGADKHFFLVPYDRFFVRHERIKNIRPFVILQDGIASSVLIKWLTNRYSRTAFPEEFDRRWKQRKERLEGVIKKLSLVQDIYIKLDPFDEIDEGEIYQIEILLLMDFIDFDMGTTYEQYDILRKELENQFNLCDGINVQSVDIASNAEITIKEIQEYARWDYSYLTYREGASR